MTLFCNKVPPVSVFPNRRVDTPAWSKCVEGDGLRLKRFDFYVYEGDADANQNKPEV